MSVKQVWKEKKNMKVSKWWQNLHCSIQHSSTNDIYLGVGPIIFASSLQVTRKPSMKMCFSISACGKTGMGYWRDVRSTSRWAPWQWIYSHDVHSLTEWKGTVCKQLIIHLFAETRVLTDLTATVKQHVQIWNQMIFNVNFSLAVSKAWE